jgi:flagellar biosynthesis/type III secretory pathway protein FliH
MIRARIIPPRAPQDLTLSVVKEHLRHAKSLANSHKFNARRVIERYSNWARRTSYQRGYEAGLAAARNDVSELLTEMRRAYDTTLEMAHLDVLETSRNLAQHIVDTALMEHPDILMGWIQQALAVLKRSRVLILRYHPRLEETIKQLSPKLLEQVQLVRDSTLTSIDLSVHGDSGGIEFSRLVSPLQGDSVSA